VASSKQKARIEVGEWVYVPLGGDPLPAQVIEDRGNLGVNGRRIVRISVPWEEGMEPREFEVAEESLIRAA
jgi:hypothetical protein